MGFRNGARCKVFEVDRREKFTKLRVSISHKNKKTDQYESDFSGFISLIGQAHKDGIDIANGDVIQIGECDVTTTYDKEKKRGYTNFNVYSLGSVDPKSAPPKPAADEDDPDDSDLPF